MHDAIFKVTHMTASVYSLPLAESTTTQASPFDCSEVHSELISIGNEFVKNCDCKKTLAENALKSIIENPALTLEISASTLLRILSNCNSQEAVIARKFIIDASTARDKYDAKLLS